MPHNWQKNPPTKWCVAPCVLEAQTHSGQPGCLWPSLTETPELPLPKMAVTPPTAHPSGHPSRFQNVTGRMTSLSPEETTWPWSTALRLWAVEPPSGNHLVWFQQVLSGFGGLLPGFNVFLTGFDWFLLHVALEELGGAADWRCHQQGGGCQKWLVAPWGGSTGLVTTCNYFGPLSLDPPQFSWEGRCS